MSSPGPQLNKRIGIIGAGPSGLTAADTLRRKGYTNITLLERNDQAGGKCSSVQHEGRSYELGAGVISENNLTVHDIAKRYGVEVKPLVFGENLFLDAETGIPHPHMTLRQKFAFITQLVFRYRKLVKRFQHVTEPGLTLVDSELCMPFGEWAKKYRVEEVAREFANYFTGFGYGYFDRVPAAYVVKFYSWDTCKAFLRQQIYIFPQGIQGLWTTVATAFNVRYNTTIQSITRAETILVKTDSEDLVFDELIITSPLDEALKILDARTEEQTLFSKIQYVNYRTYACTIKGFPKRSGHVPGNYTFERSGHPIFWYGRYVDSELYTFYILSDWALSDDVARANIEALIKPLGGSIATIEHAVHWKYFPHVSPTEMKAGYFDRLEALQGRDHTYYAGELLNFSSVDQSAWYAKTLIERFF